MPSSRRLDVRMRDAPRRSNGEAIENRIIEGLGVLLDGIEASLDARSLRESSGQRSYFFGVYGRERLGVQETIQHSTVIADQIANIDSMKFIDNKTNGWLVAVNADWVCMGMMAVHKSRSPGDLVMLDKIRHRRDLVFLT